MDSVKRGLGWIGCLILILVVGVVWLLLSAVSLGWQP